MIGMEVFCSICTDNLTEFQEKISIYDENEIVSTSCGHLFHSNCLFSWLRRQKNCPECRTTIKTRKDFHKIFFNLKLPDGDEKSTINEYQRRVAKLTQYVKQNVKELGNLENKYSKLYLESVQKDNLIRDLNKELAAQRSTPSFMEQY